MILSFLSCIMISFFIIVLSKIFLMDRFPPRFMPLLLQGFNSCNQLQSFPSQLSFFPFLRCFKFPFLPSFLFQLLSQVFQFPSHLPLRRHLFKLVLLPTQGPTYRCFSLTKNSFDTSDIPFNFGTHKEGMDTPWSQQRD